MTVQPEQTYDAPAEPARVMPPPMVAYQPRAREAFEWGVGDAVFPQVAAG